MNKAITEAALLDLNRRLAKALERYVDLHSMSLAEYRRKYGPRDDLAEAQVDEGARALLDEVEALS